MLVKEIFFESVLVIQLKQFGDSRGFFSELFHKTNYKKIGIKENFIQDNQSRSKKNVIRGMHYTVNHPQSQIMTVLSGEVFDVVVDIRKNSSTFGRWKGVYLSESGVQQIYMPHGFAHGFCVMSEYADLHYKVSKLYLQEDEAGIAWNDKEIGIEWPIKNPIVSKRDTGHPTLDERIKGKSKLL